MSAASALARGRALAESLMQDTCLIERVAVTTDPVTGAATETPTTIYSGKCRVQNTPQQQARTETPGESFLLMLRFELQLPMDASAGIAAEDRVTFTSSAFDVDLVGRVFRIHDLNHKTHMTARRVGMEEVTG